MAADSLESKCGRCSKNEQERGSGRDFGARAEEVFFRRREAPEASIQRKFAVRVRKVLASVPREGPRRAASRLFVANSALERGAGWHRVAQGGAAWVFLITLTFRSV